VDRGSELLSLLSSSPSPMRCRDQIERKSNGRASATSTFGTKEAEKVAVDSRDGPYWR
jgi:hypothetical protein